MDIYYQWSQCQRNKSNNTKQYKQNKQTDFRIEKVIKRKDDKLYAQWKGYDNLFDSWTDKRDIVIKWVILHNHIPILKAK